MRTWCRGVIVVAALTAWISSLAHRAAAAEPTADRISQWQGYEQRDFVVDGRNCLLIVPKSAAAGKPWIWRTEFFGHEPQADLALAAKGFHVAYMDVQNMYGAPVALDHMDKFYEHLTQVRGLSRRTVLEGFSRGGLFSLNWAARNPQQVACIYNDAPVCDFKSWPAGLGKSMRSPGDWQQCLAVYKLSEEQALTYKLNPVDNLAPLAAAKIPLLHVCGDADVGVPMLENTRLVERRYRKLGGSIIVIAKPGVGHHPHSLVDPTPIVAFVLRHTIGGGPAAIVPESPLERQVFQRRTRAAGEIRLRGALLAESGQLQARVIRPAATGAAEPLLVDWQPIATDRAGAFHMALTAPAGGWYRVELRLLNDDRTLTSAAVNYVGVGEVFVVAGQSNSTNSGSEKQQTTTGMVSFFDGSRWVVANDPQPGTQDDSQGGSFLPAFGDALYERYHLPIGVASTGAGATSVRQWLPAGEQMSNRPTIDAHVREISPGVWESTGDLFAGLLERIEALGPRGCRAVLWHQGESDAGQTRGGYPADRQITGQQYREFMQKLVQASRRQAHWELPWFTALATYHSEQDAADEEFRAAGRALWQSGLTLEGPDTDALGKQYRDGVHFNAQGLAAHGKLWAEKVGVGIDAQPEEK
jgi:pimeloyl-ACP methyl ester carboxylesterase